MKQVGGRRGGGGEEGKGLGEEKLRDLEEKEEKKKEKI